MSLLPNCKVLHVLSRICYFRLFLGFWLSSVLLPGDLLPGVLMPVVLLLGDILPVVILPVVLLPSFYCLATFELYCDR